jgi:hypothetical protein
VVLNFDQRNWEIFGNFFGSCELNQILLFFGKICKFLEIIELGGKQKKKKTTIVFPWQLGHQLYYL